MRRKSHAPEMIASRPGDFSAATAGHCAFGAAGSTSIRTGSGHMLEVGDGAIRDAGVLLRFVEYQHLDLLSRRGGLDAGPADYEFSPGL